MDVRKIQNLKEMLLVISILYFYGLAFAINQHKETYGLDSPTAFVVMGIVFLIALFLEVLVTWWPFRDRILAASVFILAYAYLGIFVAPALFGDRVIIISLLAPVIVTFVGGFAYVYARLLYRALFAVEAVENEKPPGPP